VESRLRPLKLSLLAPSEFCGEWLASVTLLTEVEGDSRR